MDQLHRPKASTAMDLGTKHIFLTSAHVTLKSLDLLIKKNWLECHVLFLLPRALAVGRGDATTIIPEDSLSLIFISFIDRILT